MISPAHDLFARLVISANKFKDQDAAAQPFSGSQLTEAASPMEEKVSSEIRQRPGKAIHRPIRKIKIKPGEKIEEKVSRMIDDPRLAELKKQLEEAEELFEKLKKSKQFDESKLWILENKIVELNKLVEEKCYV